MIKKIKRNIRRNIFVIKGEFTIQQIIKKFNKKNGKVFHIDKVGKILSAQELLNIDTFIETGTYLGVTTNYVKKYFKNIFSIELSATLASEAEAYFKNETNVRILQGDSGLLIEKIVKDNNSKKIFWLDAHYSSGITEISASFGHTPVSKELSIILQNWVTGSVILIDDARLFNGTNNYPRVEDVVDFIESKSLNLRIFIDKDIIHIL